MGKNDVLRRIVSALLILTLITSFFVNLPLSLSVADEGLQGGQSNIVNGSFEDPDSYRLTALAEGSVTGYKYAPQNEVTGWNTTSSTSKIELGWMNEDGTSPHMTPTVRSEIISGVGASDGSQFAETIGSDKNSTVFQSLSVNAGEEYTWTVHHRSRKDVETLALFIVDDVGVNYVKSVKDSMDHFNQILSWMRSSVKAPAAGVMVSKTVYTTALLDDGAFTSSDSGYFSFDPDTDHTVKFQVYLMSSAKANWSEYKGNYTPDSDQILFAVTSYVPISSTSGNIIDNFSFTNSSGSNLLKNPSFEDYVPTKSCGWINAASATHTSPAKNIGWGTTALDRLIEIGTLRFGVDSYNLGVKFQTNIYNAPYIRDGDQFAELNADEESSLYQIVETAPGKMYKWSLSHRGRDATDTMALIIGPAQAYAPSKAKNAQGTTIIKARDQLMQMVEWLYSQTEMAIDIPEQGSSDKIKLYSPKFNNNGGFELSSNIFSWQKDNDHTEEWSVWIISSKNDMWHDYGEIDQSATYNYSYIVPQGQDNSIFGFVSHMSLKADGSKNAMSYGNLLDNIAFKEYYYAKVEVAMNDTHGKAQIVANEEDFIQDEVDNESLKSGWAMIGSSFTIYVQEAEDEAQRRPFVGAYINNTFVPKDDWFFNEETGKYSYTVNDVSSTTKVNIIFAAKQIYYDSRSDHEYQYDPADNKTGPEVPMIPVPGQEPTYISHAPQADDGWTFIGWKYIHPSGNNVYMFDAVHKVVLEGDFEADTSLLTFSVYPSETATEATVKDIKYDEGITFLAEWKFRQRAVAKTFDKTADAFLESTEGGTVDIDVSFGAIEEKTNYPEGAEDDMALGKEVSVSSDETYVTVSAFHKKGYAFIGWYDEAGNMVSRNSNYAYKVPDGKTVDLYAYFEPYGLNLTINCEVFGETEDLTKYFKVDCTFSNLRANNLYVISNFASEEGGILFNGEKVSNPTMLRADENGNATAVLYMKHEDSGTFVFLPENCVYNIRVDSISSWGFSIRGEVNTKTLREETTEKLIFYKASQTALLDAGKHYEGIDEGKASIEITKNSSYTFQAETRYNPSAYTGLKSSLCFYGLDDVAKDFFIGTRVLMIDLSNSATPQYYSYSVSSQMSAIALTDFIELGSDDTHFELKKGDMFTEKLVFIVDYVSVVDAESGKISLEYTDNNTESTGILKSVKKTVKIGEDNTSIEASGNSNTSNNGPFAMQITVSESTVRNTTYQEGDFTNSEYWVTLTDEDGKLPDGSYAVVDGKTYYSNNGYIKISPLTPGSFNVNIYPSVPLEPSDGKVKFTATLLSAVSTSAVVPVKIFTTPIEYSCVDVAIDAEVSNKVLSPGNVRDAKITLKHKNLDEVKLSVSQKNSDGTYTKILTDINVNLPDNDAKFTVNLSNGFNAELGKTYIYSFVGYVGGIAVCNDNCCVVGGYVLKNN